MKIKVQNKSTINKVQSNKKKLIYTILILILIFILCRASASATNT